MIRKSYTTPVNQEQTWMKKGGNLDLAGYFLLNLLGRQYDTKKEAYIRTMDCQFLRTVVVRK